MTRPQLSYRCRQGAQDKHDTLRSFGGTTGSPLRTLTSSYSIQPPPMSHNASTSSTSSSSSSMSSSSHISAVAELPVSPPTSSPDDGEGDEFNDGNVMIVNSPHHSHSPSRAHQQPGQATDEEDESEPAFRIQDQEEESEPQPPPQPQTPLLSPAVTMSPSTSSTPSRRPSGVSIVADDDEFAEAKLRREKLIAGKAARLAKKSKHERWEMDNLVSRDSKHKSAARRVSRLSDERNADSDGSSSSTSSSSSTPSSSDHSDDEKREVDENGEPVGDPAGTNSKRRSPALSMTASPPSPVLQSLSQRQPSSRSSSPVKTYRQHHQHDDPYHQFQHHANHHDEPTTTPATTTTTTRRRTSTKQRAEERRPSDNTTRAPSPLPPSHPPILSRTNSHSSSRSKKRSAVAVRTKYGWRTWSSRRR